MAAIKVNYHTGLQKARSVRFARFDLLLLHIKSHGCRELDRWSAPLEVNHAVVCHAYFVLHTAQLILRRSCLLIGLALLHNKTLYNMNPALPSSVSLHTYKANRLPHPPNKPCSARFHGRLVFFTLWSEFWRVFLFSFLLPQSI